MKTLNLSSMNVTELKQDEMVEVNGGGITVPVLVFKLGQELVAYIVEKIESKKED